MVSNDAGSGTLVKAEAAAGGGRRPAFTRASIPVTIFHQGQWATACRCLKPRHQERIDRLSMRNSPTQNSKEPDFFEDDTMVSFAWANFQNSLVSNVEKIGYVFEARIFTKFRTVMLQNGWTIISV
jgi:hypothetical protein